MTEAGGPSGRSRLHLLYDDYGQSPWIDNLTRPMLSTGRLQELVDAGVRGVTSNPTIFAKAFSASSDYDDEFAAMVERQSVEDAYWQMVIEDVSRALDILDPVHRDSGGTDGFVSLEVSPVIAHDAAATVEAARSLHGRINRSNLMVKIPATAEGVAAIRTMVSEAADINVTLIFSLERYDQVIEAYLSGLEAVEGDLSGVQSVASFFVSRVDTLVDRRLEEIGTPEAMGLRGQVALAQARLAYDLFRRRFSGPRWDALRARGACLQRPLWASTSTKNPDYPDLLYVDGLIGPDTVDTLPDATLEAFLDHGQLGRTVDADVEGARRIFERLAEIGIDMEEIAAVLEDEGVAAFSKSFDELLQHLHQEAAKVAGAP